MTSSVRTVLTLSALAAASTVALADGEGDVGLLFTGNSIVTSLANDETGEFTSIGERVFAADIDFASNLGGSPGFFTTDGPTLPGGFTPFAVGTTISYQTNGAIQEWNGSEFVATSNRLRQITIPGVLEILSPTDGSVTPGFEYTYSGGDFDEHPDYALLDGSTPGIFLWKVQFSAFNGASLLGSSSEAWIVFNFGLSEADHDLAIEFAEANIPAPGALAALAVGGVIASRRRRA